MTNRTPTERPQGVVAPFFPAPDAAMATPWRIDVYAAEHEPGRWRDYLVAAHRSYASRGLAAIGEEQVIDVDRYPTWFAEAVVAGPDGAPMAIGGIRIHGPDADGDLLLFEELNGYTDVAALRAFTRPLCDDGLCHGGGLWIDPRYARAGVAADLARACLPIIAATRVRWCVAMTHQCILAAWGSLGWHEVTDLPTFVYPDERYTSRIILGGPETWPAAAGAWAARQVGNADLDGPGVRFVIDPLRAWAPLQAPLRATQILTRSSTCSECPSTS